MLKRTHCLPQKKCRQARRFTLEGLCALLLILIPANNALAEKSYTMENVSIVADLAADGSMTISEERTYKFQGRYKYAYRTFPLDGRVGYEDFQVSENNQPYQLSRSQEPGTFTVTTNNQEIEVRWYYRAHSETRTFVIHYQVNNAVQRYRDGAVLYYKFIGEKFNKSTGNLSITVNPPVLVDQWKVRQWAHGPLWGSSATSDQGIVSASCQNLPKKQFFELRILYPADIFGETPQNTGYIVDEITTEESAWSDAANLRREQARANSASLEKRKNIGAWALPLVVMVAGVWFYRIASQYGTRPSVPTIASSSPEVPSDLPPAMVGYLINGRTVSPSAVMATMMDLARRGFLEFSEEQELGRNFFGREKWKISHSWMLKQSHYQEHGDNLADFENMLVKFVFEDLAANQSPGSDTVTVDLETFKKHKSKVQKFFGKWSKEIKKAGEKHNFFDQNSFEGRNKGLMLGGALLVLSLPMIPLVHALALIPAIAGVVIMLGSNGIVHHNREGRIQEKKWKSLKSFLTGQKFKSSEPNAVLDFIEPYFIYGVVMGMTKKQLDGLGSMIPMNKGVYYMPWYHRQDSGDGFGGSSFGSAFSTAVASVNSAMSSSTGAGGGASGGGGGGSGGGGGGAG